jgi:transcription initiation factor IIE alpha subunit
MTNLTEKETAMIAAFIREGIRCNGSATAEELLSDNMTWMSATDLCDTLGWNKQEVGGVMSALQEKGLIEDSGESARGARDTDWTASNQAIKEFFHLCAPIRAA